MNENLFYFEPILADMFKASKELVDTFLGSVNKDSSA